MDRKIQDWTGRSNLKVPGRFENLNGCDQKCGGSGGDFLAFWILDVWCALGASLDEGVGVFGKPRHVRTFESFLNDLFVGAFNHASANRHAPAASFAVVELVLAGAQVTVGH